MIQLLAAAAIFSGVVWMIAYTIHLLLRREVEPADSPEARDGFSRFVEENYGPRFMPAHGVRQR